VFFCCSCNFYVLLLKNEIKKKREKIGGLFNQNFFKLIPLKISISLAQKIPRIVWYLPSDKDVQFDKYLGNIKVRVNTRFPIERVMLSGYYDRDTLFIIDKFVKRGCLF